MYTPSVPPPRNENPPTTSHLHPPNQSLTEHENNELFEMYLNGRTLTYARAVSDTLLIISNSKKVLDRNPADPSLRALVEGQIEAANEILELLKKAKNAQNAQDTAPKKEKE